MNLFDELAKDSEEYLAKWEQENTGDDNGVLNQIADLEKRMNEKLEAATKNLFNSADAAAGNNVPNENNEGAGTGTDAATESEDK